MSTPVRVRKISDLKIRNYADTINGETLDCEPTRQDVNDAIQADRLETRNYQTELEALKAEWIDESEKSPDPLATWRRLATEYHSGRIAHFVVNGWDHPISINSNDEVTDGTHRIKAAILNGDSEVEVIIQR